METEREYLERKIGRMEWDLEYYATETRETKIQLAAMKERLKKVK